MIGKLLYYFTHNQDYRRDNLGTIKVRYLLIAVNLFLVLYFKRTVAPSYKSTPTNGQTLLIRPDFRYIIKKNIILFCTPQEVQPIIRPHFHCRKVDPI